MSCVMTSDCVEAINLTFIRLNHLIDQDEAFQ